MEAEPPKADPPKRKRRWFQFSLRTLLVSTIIIAVACGWLGKRIEQKRKDRETVAAIIKLGGIVTYDYQTEDLHAEPPGPSWLRSMLGENFFSEVNGVWLRNATDADSAVARLKGVAQLRVLNLWKTKVGDGALRHLNELLQLEELNLEGTSVTDVGLSNLTGSTQLRGLSLARTEVSDAGLEHLKGLSQLELLQLDNTSITDAGLVNFIGSTKLQELDLRETKVTDAGAKGLQKALPGCKLVR